MVNLQKVPLTLWGEKKKLWNTKEESAGGGKILSQVTEGDLSADLTCQLGERLFWCILKTES